MKLLAICVSQFRMLCFLFVSCVVTTAYAEQAPNDQALQEADEPTQSAILAIAVSNFKNEKGKLFISVYANKEDWLGENKVMTQDLVIGDAIVDGVIELQLELPIGEYALSVFHDKNSNDKLDANFIGIPKEPAVVSNNAPARFGPPKYKDAKFLLDSDGARQDLEF